MIAPALTNPEPSPIKNAALTLPENIADAALMTPVPFSNSLTLVITSFEVVRNSSKVLDSATFAIYIVYSIFLLFVKVTV